MDSSALHAVIDDLDPDQVSAAARELLLERLDLDYSRQATFLLEEHARRAGVEETAIAAARAQLKAQPEAGQAMARAVLKLLAKGSEEDQDLVATHVAAARQRDAEAGRSTLPGGLGIVGLVSVLRRVEKAELPEEVEPVTTFEELWALVGALRG